MARAEQSVRRAERADQLGDEGGAPHAAAGIHFEAVLARVVAHEAKAHVVPADRRAVARRGGEGELELARQVAEFRVEGRHQIGRAHVSTPVTNAPLVCRLLLENKKIYTNILNTNCVY